jgi:CO/xanthine dehydrogenase FAD-binding subunit
LRGQKLDPNTIAIARQTLAQEIVPIDDIRSTKHYRLQVSLNLLGDFLSRISSPA